MAPRGAAHAPGVPRIGYHVPKKSDIWSENAAMLYEEAVQRQWSSATDIPWDELKPLPDDVERAYSQFCTFLTEVEFIAGDTPSQWLPADQQRALRSQDVPRVADHGRGAAPRRLPQARARERRRPDVSRAATPACASSSRRKDFTEMSTIMHVQGEGLVQSIFRMGEYIATNEAEKRIFRLSAQDESRHVAFGVMHLKYILETEPERREEIHSYLEKAEPIIGAGAGTAPVAGGSPVFGTSLGILFGHTLGSPEEGGKHGARRVPPPAQRVHAPARGRRHGRAPLPPARQIQALLDPPKA